MFCWISGSYCDYHHSVYTGADGQSTGLSAGPAAVVPEFFVSCEEFLRSWLGPGWLELPICDCRLLMDIGRSCHTTFPIVNQQSAIAN
jgi:hypothetical protein